MSPDHCPICGKLRVFHPADSPNCPEDFMSPDPKPSREFWICTPDYNYHQSVFDYTLKPPMDGLVHVIEKSAYDQAIYELELSRSYHISKYDTLLAKSLKLREALNKSKCALRYAYKITCYDYYLNASDDIDKALEER